jgi:hypothetical protein
LKTWRNIQPFSLTTNQGGNFDGKGESKIDVRAVHDGTWAYFLFTWEDPTRSLKHLPLIKEIDGWRLLHDGYEVGDEHDYHEDKFSVLLTTLDGTLAGDRTFHASPHPIPEAPATMTGRGLHFTVGDIGYVDVWQWKATSGGPTGWMDDASFGPPLTSLWPCAEDRGFSRLPGCPREGMMLRHGISLIAAAIVTLGIGSASAQDSVAQFYKGRQITLIVGSSAGGGYDDMY